MSRWKRRQRNNKSFEVRDALQQRAGYYERLAEATPQQRATTLVIECGDSLLEFLVTTATESLDRAGRGERKRDEKLLTEALDDRAAVEKAWVFLAHGQVQWTLDAARRAGAEVDVPMHEAAAALLRDEYPLDNELAATLRVAPRAEELGFYSEEFVLTSGAFDALLGDRAEQLTLLADPEPYTDAQLLRIVFEHGSDRYVELVAAGVVPLPGRA